MFHTYIIAYDPLMGDPTPRRLIEFVKTHAHTYQYYIHHLGSIFIKSPAQLHEMVETYRDFLAPNIWTICEISQPEANSGGSAPMQFWNWFNAAFPPVLDHQK